MAAVATAIGDTGSGGIPGGSGGGSDITGELGSLLSSGYDSAESGAEEVPGGEGGNEPSLPYETTGDVPGGESGEPQASAAPADQSGIQAGTANQPDPIPGWKLSQDGQSYTVPVAELPRVQSALQYSEAVSQFFGSPQEAEFAYQGASQMRQMQNDWAYGTDDAIKSVLGFLAGSSHPDAMGRSSFARSFGRMLQLAPDVLQQTNPQAYSALVSSFGQRLAGSMYEKAAQTAAQYGADSQVAKDALMEAQAVEWGLTGKYQTEVPRLDPQAQQRAQFEQQQRDFQARQGAALRRDVEGFNRQHVEGAKLNRLDQMIAEKLAPIKERFPETAFNDLVAGIHREVMDTLAQQSDWYTEHRQTFDQLINDYRMTWQQGSPGNGLQPRIGAYIQDFLSRAGRIMPSIAQKRINAATQARVNAVNGRNRTNANNGNGANASNRQNQPAATPSGNGQNGETRSSKFDREFNAMFSQFRQ